MSTFTVFRNVSLIEWPHLYVPYTSLLHFHPPGGSTLKTTGGKSEEMKTNEQKQAELAAQILQEGKLTMLLI